MGDSAKAELLLILEELERRRCRESARSSLASFAKYASRGRWRRTAHLELLADRLQAAGGGIEARIIVQMPPRHGKSELGSVLFPAWAVGAVPDRNVILASYAASLAEGFGRRARDLLNEFGPELFAVQVADDSSAAGRWNVAGHRGGMVAVGVGGAITGRGADLLIIDDPVKNAEDAFSQAFRDKQWEWWQTTARTRLEPGAAVVVIMTRWHEDDLAGRLIREMTAGGETWEVLRLPAIAEDGDPLGRRPGEALWPQRFDAGDLEAIRIAVGSRAWNALYQQRPAPDEGGILRRSWWRYYRQAPVFDEQLQSWDMTFKDTAGSNFVVGQVWGRRGAEEYLLDQVRERMDFPTTVAAVRSLSAKWPLAAAKLVEDRANGPAVIATLKREIPGLIAVEPQGGKVARAAAVSPAVEAGNVYLPAPEVAPWIHDFVEECAAFPNGANDDQVDTMTQALLRLVQYSPVDDRTRRLMQEARFYA